MPWMTRNLIFVTAIFDFLPKIPLVVAYATTISKVGIICVMTGTDMFRE